MDDRRAYKAGQPVAGLAYRRADALGLSQDHSGRQFGPPKLTRGPIGPLRSPASSAGAGDRLTAKFLACCRPYAQAYGYAYVRIAVCSWARTMAMPDLKLKVGARHRFRNSNGVLCCVVPLKAVRYHK